MSFSVAKVWRVDEKDSTMEELAEEDAAQEKENDDFWNRFLREKQEKIAVEKTAVEHLRRGARRRTRVNYADTLESVSKRKKRPLSENSSGDKDFEHYKPQQQIPAFINGLVTKDQLATFNIDRNVFSEYNGQQLLQLYIQLLHRVSPPPSPQHQGQHQPQQLALPPTVSHLHHLSSLLLTKDITTLPRSYLKGFSQPPISRDIIYRLGTMSYILNTTSVRE